MNKLSFLFQILKNMGLRYVIFRVKYEFLRKTGLLKHKFPTSFRKKEYISLNEWKQTAKPFFFESKETLKFQKNPTLSLKEEAKNIFDGRILFFNAKYFDLGSNYNWITNPDNNYAYTLKHWTEIPDFSSETGDIKFVWEKSRFSYLYTVIRYDYHFSTDCSDFVFKEIISWIEANPLNQGPNYRCSQEISIRILNWLFALYYYRNSKTLTEEIFDKITNIIYWQLKHIYDNIDFSRIAVRNNHAITETLTLYLAGILMPFFPDSKKWKKQGKKWFEEEIAYQVYEDGTFLQFSMNYHRVLVQLLTWALGISSKNGESFNNVVKSRITNTLSFLLASQDRTSGYLPNYGANDGALFFPLSNQKYRDYRPQLNALHFAYYSTHLYADLDILEDSLWYGATESNLTESQPIKKLSSFAKGGYYIIKDDSTMTFLRCGSHKDRPSQADNLHLDIWVGNENIIRDAGSYKYNTEEQFKAFFNGTSSHNTVMLGDFDQMKKGPRFIWYNWTQAVSAKLYEDDEFYIFEGSIKAFEHIAKDIIHQRTVKKHKNKLFWEITDYVTHQTTLPLNQIWNPSEYFFTNFAIYSTQTNGDRIEAKQKTGWYSGLYGVKEATNQLIFSTNEQTIKTIIKTKELS